MLPPSGPTPDPVEDFEIMADHAAQILAELGALRGQLDRVENRLERVETVTERVAVLERQDTITRGNVERFWAQQWPELTGKIVALEETHRALIKVEALEDRVAELRDTVAELREVLATKAATETMDAEAGRITALETDGARREGYSKALIVVWTAITAAPGLVGLGLTLWKVLG